LEVETWWRAADGPVTRLFSVMAHLVADDGAVLGVADGLGVSPLVMAPGDVLVQRHQFAMPPEDAAVWLRTGGYWFDTGVLWSVEAFHSDTALFTRLEWKW
jgi:hypothetical protein